jgi:hypothetical protein
VFWAIEVSELGHLDLGVVCLGQTDPKFEELDAATLRPKFGWKFQDSTMTPLSPLNVTTMKVEKGDVLLFRFIVGNSSYLDRLVMMNSRTSEIVQVQVLVGFGQVPHLSIQQRKSDSLPLEALVKLRRITELEQSQLIVMSLKF